MMPADSSGGPSWAGKGTGAPRWLFAPVETGGSTEIEVAKPFYASLSYSIGLLYTYAALCVVAMLLVRSMWRRTDDEGSVLNVPLAMCVLSVAVGFAALLLPFLCIATGLGVDISLMHLADEAVTVMTSFAVSLALPFAYFFHEADASKGVFHRIWETFTVLTLLLLLRGCVFIAMESSLEDITTQILSVDAKLAALVLLVVVPRGWGHLINDSIENLRTVGSALSRGDRLEEIDVLKFEESALRQQIRRHPEGGTRPPKVQLMRQLTNVRTRRMALETQAKSRVLVVGRNVAKLIYAFSVQASFVYAHIILAANGITELFNMAMEAAPSLTSPAEGLCWNPAALFYIDRTFCSPVDEATRIDTPSIMDVWLMGVRYLTWLAPAFVGMQISIGPLAIDWHNTDTGTIIINTLVWLVLSTAIPSIHIFRDTNCRATARPPLVPNMVWPVYAALLCAISLWQIAQVLAGQFPLYYHSIRQQFIRDFPHSTIRTVRKRGREGGME